MLLIMLKSLSLHCFFVFFIVEISIYYLNIYLILVLLRFLEAAKGMGVDASRCLAIEDSM